MKMAKIKKKPSGYPNESKSRPCLLLIFIENYNNVLLYLGFFGVQMGQKFSSFSVVFYTFWHFFDSQPVFGSIGFPDQ